MTTKIDKDHFIDVFNDTESYPTVQDVADELSIPKQKVSQLANRYRKQDEPIINRRRKDQPVGGVEKTDDDTASVTFFIDSDLNVSVQTRVNTENLAQVLIDNDYISPEHREDEFACHLAFILMVNEITSQYIEEYAGK